MNYNELAKFANTTILFRDLVKMKSGVDIIQTNDSDKKWIDKLHKDTTAFIKSISKEDYSGVNHSKFGLLVEQLYIDYLHNHKYDIQTPKTNKGKRQSVGYPDAVVIAPKSFYLEIKTMGKDKRNDTARTFFDSVGKSTKITHSLPHLVLGFVKGPHNTITGYHMSDLYNLSTKVKIEFNSNNKQLYDENALI